MLLHMSYTSVKNVLTGFWMSLWQISVKIWPSVLHGFSTERYVLIQFNGRRWRTRTCPVMPGEVTEWDDVIPLWDFPWLFCSLTLTTFSPSDLLTILRLSICTSFEFVSKIENEETLQFSVADLVDRCESDQCKWPYYTCIVIWFHISLVVMFPVKGGHAELHVCSSLLATTERKTWTVWMTV